MRDALIELFDALERHKVEYCVLHGWQSLPMHVDSDIDLAVGKQHLDRLAAALHNLATGRVIQFVLYKSNGYCFNIAFTRESVSTLVQFDVCTEYRHNGIVHMNSAEMLSGRRRHRTIWIADLKIEFRYLLTKKTCKGFISAKQKRRLRELCEELGGEAPEVVTSVFGRRWGERVTRWLRCEDWPALETALPGMHRAMYRQALRRDPLGPLRFWLPEISRLWKRLRYPTGLWVAVLGPDGAGKTSIIEGLPAELQGAFRRTVRYHYRPMLLYKRANQGPVTEPHKEAPRSAGGSLMKLAGLAADYMLGYWLRIRPALVRNRLVLFDRYYDDMLVDPRRYRYGASLRWASFARRFVPQPDIWILLEAPIEVLESRKREVATEELRRQTQAYREVVGRRANALTVDAAAPLEEVRKTVCAYVLDHLERRYWAHRQLWIGSG